MVRWKSSWAAAPTSTCKLRGDLRRHALRYGAGGVVAGGKKVEGEAAFGVGSGGVANPGGGVDGDDGGLGYAASGGIEHGASNGAGGGILSASEGGKQNKDNEKRARHSFAACGRDAAWRLVPARITGGALVGKPESFVA